MAVGIGLVVSGGTGTVGIGTGSGDASGANGFVDGNGRTMTRFGKIDRANPPPFPSMPSVWVKGVALPPALQAQTTVIQRKPAQAIVLPATQTPALTERRNREIELQGQAPESKPQQGGV